MATPRASTTGKRSIGQTTRRSYSKDFANLRQAGKPNPAIRYKPPVAKASPPKATAKPMTGIQRAMTTYGVVDRIIKTGR